MPAALARVAPVPAAAGGGAAGGALGGTSFFTWTTAVGALHSLSLRVTPPDACWALTGAARASTCAGTPTSTVRMRVRIEAPEWATALAVDPTATLAGFERAGVNHTCSLEVTRLFRAKTPARVASPGPVRTFRGRARTQPIE